MAAGKTPHTAAVSRLSVQVYASVSGSGGASYTVDKIYHFHRALPYHWA